MKHVINKWAPQCALPDCNTLVGYHKKYTKADGTPGAKWKTFCEHHRTVGKGAQTIFKQSRGGCENRDGRLSSVCKDPFNPSLTIDHWDGNKHNNNQDNLVVLCANCHTIKTKLHGNHLTTYRYVTPHFDNLFEMEVA